MDVSGQPLSLTDVALLADPTSNWPGPVMDRHRLAKVMRYPALSVPSFPLLAPRDLDVSLKSALVSNNRDNLIPVRNALKARFAI